MLYGAIFQPAIPKTRKESLYTNLYSSRIKGEEREREREREPGGEIMQPSLHLLAEYWIPSFSTPQLQHRLEIALLSEEGHCNSRS